ncbi:MAG: lipopolysaccharide assembly LapA domain-containing protein [Paracoccaceae bacterium]
MRTIRSVIAILLLIAVAIIMAANMTPVDLHLIPERFAPGLPTLKSVPVALVIVLALLAGILIGFLMEFARETKHRRRLDQKRREVASLRDKNAELSSKLEDEGDEIAAIRG